MTLILIAAFMVYLNSFIRVVYPSSYVPYTASTKNPIGHPITARILATIGELIFYYKESEWLNKNGDNGILIFYLAIIGECLCWIYVVKQSELFGFLEDCTWFIAQLFACYTLILQYRFFDLFLISLFIIYMLLIHLPNTFQRVDFKKPIINRLPQLIIAEQDQHTKQWVNLSLICLAAIYTYFHF